MRLGGTAAECRLEAISVTASSDGGESVRSRDLKFEGPPADFCSILLKGGESSAPLRVLQSATGTDPPFSSNRWEEFHPDSSSAPDFSFKALADLLGTCSTLVPALSGRWELQEPGKTYSGTACYSMVAFEVGTDSSGNVECIVLCVQSNNSDRGGGAGLKKAYFALGIGKASLMEGSDEEPWLISPLRIRKLTSFSTFVEGPRTEYEFWTGTDKVLRQTGGDTILKRVSWSKKAGGASSLLPNELREKVITIFNEILTVTFADAVVAGDLQRFNKVLAERKQQGNLDTIQFEPIKIALQRGRSGVALMRHDVPMIPILAAAMYGQEKIIRKLLEDVSPSPDVFVLAVASFCDKARDALLDAVKRDPDLLAKASSKATCPPVRGLGQPHPLSHPPSRMDPHPLHLEGCTLLQIVARCMFSAHSSWRSKYTASVEGLVRAGAEHTICTAIQCGDHAWVQEADLKPGELDVIFTADKYGNGAVPLGSHTPLTGAVFVNDLEMVNVLLDKGAAFFKTRDSVRHSDTTAIHQAVMFDLDSANKFPTLRRLLRHYVKLRSDGARIPEDMENLNENLSGERDPKRHAGGGSWRDTVHQDAWGLIVNVDSFFSGGDEGLEFLDDAAGSLHSENLEGESVLPGGTPSGGTNILADASQSSTAPAASKLAEAPAAVRGYAFQKFLGEGGQGTVWLAREEATGGAVAIKICLQDIKRVGREVSNLKLLHTPRVHPNVVQFLKFFTPGAALVMEFIDGKSLNQHLKVQQGAGLDEEEAMWIMRGLLRGVSVLHEKKVIHRDIKPDNIMLRAPGDSSDRCDRVVIVDFGTSKQLTTKTITKPWSALGTPAYSSPEQTNGSDPELGMDVWAAGVVYFEMLEGHRPFPGEWTTPLQWTVPLHNDKALEHMIRTAATPTMQAAITAGSSVEEFVNVALEKKAKNRFPDGTHMLEAFEQVCASPNETPESLKPGALRTFSVRSGVPEWVEMLRKDPQGALSKRADFEQRPAGTADAADRGVAVFSAGGGTGAQVHPEADTILKIFNKWCPFHTPVVHSHATVESLASGVASFESGRIMMVHVAAHTINGRVALEGRPVATKGRPHFPKAILDESFVTLMTAKGTVELVVLSACNSLELGNKLHRKGVPYVVCWVGEVHVSWCLSFSKVFYGYLMNNAGCYGAAFETTCAVIDTKHPRSRASNAASPCILWDDGKGPGSAVDGDWVSKQGSAAGRSVWRELGLRELAEEEEKEQEEPSPPPPDSMPLDFSPAAPASSSSEDDGEGEEEEDDDEVTRMANNRKGQAELKGFQMLGFNLDLAEEGIRGYRAWEFDGETVKLYGLVEERKYPLYEYGELVAGKFLLMYQTQALRDIFGDQSISGYTDLWKAGGVIESAAPTVSTEARKGALMFFRESLSIRQKQRGDDTHKHMTEEIKRAIGAIGKSVKEEEAAEKEAGTRHAAEEAAKKKEEAEAARTADNTRRRLLQEAATEEAAAEKEAAERKAVAEREAAALTAAGLSSQEQRHAATQANKEEKKAKKQEKANRRL